MADFNTLYEQLKASAQSAAKSANTLVTMMTADENTDVGIDGFGLKPSFSKQLKTRTQPLIDQMSAFLDQSDATFDQFLVTSVARVTQFLQNSGYQVIGDYTDGPYTLGNYNSVVKYDGSLYKLKSDTDVPFTTTGTTASSWANDSSHFYAIDGDMLSQQLASDLPGNGSSLIGDEVDGTVKDALVRSRLNTREIWRRSLAEAGLTLVDGSFEDGATANSKTDAVWYMAGAQCYTWGGVLPKTVVANSTPGNTGGESELAWKFVGDTGLRADLAAGDGSIVGLGGGYTVADLSSVATGAGDALLAVKQPYDNTTSRTQHDKNAETLSILDFYIPNQPDWTQAFKNAARVSADVGKQIFVPAGIYLVSDSIPLYDDGYGTRTEPDIQSYYKGNGTQFIGEGRKTIIRKTAVSTKDVNAVFYINSTNVPPTENGKRGMAIKNMSIIDLTDNSAGIYNNNGVVCSHFENLFIMARNIGVWIVGSFVDVTFYGVVVQGHEDTATYPLRYGFRVGSGTGTSISLDRCHVGSCQIDAYEIRSQYSKIGVLSVDNCLGIAYVFREFRGHIQSLGSEWFGDFTGNPSQNGTWMLAESSQISIGLCSMLGKYSNSYLFDLKSSTIKIDQVNATDNCVFIGSPARLRTSSLLDIGYFTQYKYEQFPSPIDYDGTTNCFATIGDLSGTQYRLREGNAVYGMFKIPTAQPTGECYRIMGTKSTANMSGCVGTITATRGGTSISRAALMMDVVCNGNGNIGTSAIAVKRAVSDPVGLSSYTGWYEGTVDGVLYMMLKMDTLGARNLGSFFTGTTIGRDPHLFRVVTPGQITGLVASTIGVMKTETAS